jgi:hypothetical protein
MNSSSNGKPDISIRDGWDQAFALAHGLVDLLHVGAASSDLISPDALKTLALSGDSLIDQLEIINQFFKGGAE